MQRSCNCDKIQDEYLTPEYVLSILIHRSPFCIIKYTSYKLNKMLHFGHTQYINVQCESKKVVPLKLFAIFSLMVNLCN